MLEHTFPRAGVRYRGRAPTIRGDEQPRRRAPLAGDRRPRRVAPGDAGGRGHPRFRTAVVLLLAAFLLLVVPVLVREQGGLDRSESRVSYAGQRVSYTVRPGDTLWSIARRIAPGRDPRPVVDQLIADNHLQGDLQVGQAIELPAPPR
jgi:hypothetical protein